MVIELALATVLVVTTAIFHGLGLLVIENHPYRPLADFGRKLVRRLARHGSTFSGVGASDKPGAIQSAG